MRQIVERLQSARADALPDTASLPSQPFAVEQRQPGSADLSEEQQLPLDAAAAQTQLAGDEQSMPAPFGGGGLLYPASRAAPSGPVTSSRSTVRLDILMHEHIAARAIRPAS